LLDPQNVPWDRLYIDNPENPENGIHLSETMTREELREYWRQFQKIRREKDRRNLLGRVPQHIRNLFSSPGDEISIVLNRLRTRREGHI
jgi:septation ring formation regulator EzrA